MNQFGKKIALLVVLLPLFTFVVAQPVSPADSLLYHLKAMKGVENTDSLHYDDAVRLIYSNTKYILLENDQINGQLQRLEKALDERSYYDLVADFYNSHFDLDSIPYDALIKYGQNFFKQHYGKGPAYGSFTALGVLRSLRIPFRNSSRIYEGIQYFNAVNTDFLARKEFEGASIAYNVLSGFYYRLGLHDKAEYNMLRSIELLDDRQLPPNFNATELLFGKPGKVNRYSVLGSYLIERNKPEEAEVYISEAIRNYLALETPMMVSDAPFLFLQKARCKTLLNSDSSGYYYDLAFHYMKLYDVTPLEYAHFFMEKANDFLNKDLLDSAEYYILKCKILKDSQRLYISSYMGELIPHYYYAAIKLKQDKPREAIALLLSEVAELRPLNTRLQFIQHLKLLAQAYSAAGMNREGLATLQESMVIKEKLEEEESNAKSLSFDIEKKMQENDIKIAVLKAQDKSNQKAKYYLYGITALLALFAITLGVSFFNKQKLNARLTIKNDETTKALEQLKQTQSQLIQSEKMASLGELTAGIAHEIQNPLNFVNNFSEVNTELIDEMKEELEAGKTAEAIRLANDVRENNEKITHHGKRADSIVKGMLQHSRNSSGQKEPTDINALADECMRLSYHGLRAKDKNFNAKTTTDFDNHIPPVIIAPQDIGRVILNLFTNAFYSVMQKKKKLGDTYEPAVSVRTVKTPTGVSISIRDNGMGVPQKVIDKIFQPFFTTKPVGEGTGLGLSLSYEIITKGHGGELKVATREGEYAEFIIILPV